MAWRLFYGNGEQQAGVSEKLKKLEPPPWRRFGKKEEVENNDRWQKLPDNNDDALCQKLPENGEKDNNRWQKLQKLAATQTRAIERGKNFRIFAGEKNSTAVDDVINAVNAAIYLRRPLLVTGKPGSGKTTLAYAIAYELNLGPVLSWSITARSTLQEGLYYYDAIARLQDAQQKEQQDIGKYITLGALGTAFLPSDLPRVLLIDEIDKSDINLPNDLLNIFEEGEFAISQLVRRSQSGKENRYEVDTQDKDIKAVIKDGRVSCCAFPIIVMTSNGERDFPPAFKRRCLRVTMPEPNEAALQAIVKAHFGQETFDKSNTKILELIKEYSQKQKNQSVERATDQLLNTVYLLTGEVKPSTEEEKSLKEILLKSLTSND